MKRSQLILTVIICVVTVFTSGGCRKYPDGPSISLRSKTARLTNTWRVELYLKNGNDLTPSFAGYTETYTNSGDYMYILDATSGNGKWTFDDNDRQVRITGIHNQPSQTLYIMRLESSSFWYYYFDGKDQKEFHLVPAN